MLRKCPDCNMDMTVHTLKYIKRRGFCKAEKAEPEKTPEPEPACASYASPKITEDIVNQYIQESPEIVSNSLRNERLTKPQRKQMHVRSLLNNVF